MVAKRKQQSDQPTPPSREQRRVQDKRMTHRDPENPVAGSVAWAKKNGKPVDESKG